MASGMVGLLALTYVLPAYADRGLSPGQRTTASIGAQAVDINLATFVVDANTVAVRDGYSVTKLGPQVNSYGRISDNFANNPSNTIIQWPFTHGVPIASGFGPRTAPCGGCSTFHDGLDLVPGMGTPIEAIADGVVSKVGNPDGSFGVFAMIDHVIDGQKVTSLYGHMMSGTLALSVGQKVKKGQFVGNVGSTGASSGAHLHLSIYLNGTLAIDPWPWMKQKVGS